jgi:hypothetical protein
MKTTEMHGKTEPKLETGVYLDQSEPQADRHQVEFQPSTRSGD